ncbi:MAG: hypothetical protein IJH39_10705 [Clostridia bacterium]|nr:hypothetical protein [Clostridia bacterium]
MYKKLLIGTSVILSIIFSFTFCFAADEMNQAVNGVRNVVGGAENTMEDAAQGMSNMAKDATNNIEKGANNTAKNIGNAMNNNDDNNKNYAASRTAAEVGAESTFLGISSTVWTWIIVGIAVAALIALVWYFSTQKTNNHYDD